MLLLTITISFGGLAAAIDYKKPTPVMGWNSYNHYGCSPDQTIMETNAKGLVDLGLSNLGYQYVTTDCGWNADSRSSSGELQWNSTLFPDGGVALGEYIHGLGLKFGVYSGGGYYQCGSTDLPASLGHETTDANTFASWGADSLKYDNCYSTSNTTMVDYTSAGSGSPTRYQTMASAVAATSRDIVFQVCQWGVGSDIGTWASQIADSWRVSNDIQDNWLSIWRITNEVIPYFKYTTTGAHPDMDMLIVGLNVLNQEEERFHFGMWAINKSPLILGLPTSTSTTSADSISVVSNTEVIALNQDSLGEQARLIRRYTEQQYDIFAGNLSSSRLVVALANWANSTQTISVDLATALGIASASAHDIWAETDSTISGIYTTSLVGHQLQLLVLSNIVKSTTTQNSIGYYTAIDATLSGNAVVVDCNSTQCLPVHAKVGNIGQGAGSAAVTFSSVSATTAGTHLVGVDFINYDVALATAWTGATNTRNMTIAVNGGTATRWAFPISGGDWYDTGRLWIEVDGFVAGKNSLVFAPYGTDAEWAPDLVGFEVFEAATSSKC